MTLADRIAVMDRGRIAQIAPPEEVYETPASRYVAEFVGDVNIFAGRVARREGGAVLIEAEAGLLAVESEDTSLAPGETVLVAVRPEKIAISQDEPAQAANKLSGTIREAAYVGGVTMLRVRIGNGDGPLMKVALANRTRSAERASLPEQPVWLCWSAGAAVLLKA